MAPLRPDRERLAVELILAAKNVESVTRQDLSAKPLADPPSVFPGTDPWADFDAHWDGHRLYCYRSLDDIDRAAIAERATRYRSNLALWYDLRERGPIIIQITANKLVKIPPETAYLAAFWVAVPGSPH